MSDKLEVVINFKNGNTITIAKDEINFATKEIPFYPRELKFIANIVTLVVELDKSYEKEK